MTTSDKPQYNEGEELVPTGYVVEKYLGRGAIAEAYLVSRDGEKFVLKISTNGMDKSLKEEAAIMKALADIPAVPHLFEYKNNLNGNSYVVTEYVTPEYQNLVTLRQQDLSEKELVPIFESILKFFDNMHTLGYEYCDVKPDHFYWDPENSEKPLLVIDYNLSRKRQKPSSSRERLRWVVSDLRRLGQVLFRSLLIGQEIVPELPGASRPIPFDGDSLYDYFLPTSFKNDQSGHQSLDWYLRRLHAGKYGTAREALDEFKTLTIGTIDFDDITSKDYKYVEEQVSGWMQIQPSWDEVEKCWGLLGEPFLSSVDKLRESDEIAVFVYLWGVALSYKKPKGIDKSLADCLQKNVEINQKYLQDDDAILLFNDWHNGIVDLGAKKERAWNTAINAFERGYEKALPSLKSFYDTYQPGGVYGVSNLNLNSWQAYINKTQIALKIWTYKDRVDYATIDGRFALLIPHKEDVLLADIKTLYLQHLELRGKLSFFVMSDSPDQNEIDIVLTKIEEIQNKIFAGVIKLLSPQEVFIIWPEAETLKSKAGKLISLAHQKHDNLEIKEKMILEEEERFLEFINLESNEMVNIYKDLFANKIRARHFQGVTKDLENRISPLLEKIRELSDEVERIKKKNHDTSIRDAQDRYISILEVSVDIIDKIIQ